MGFYNWVGEIEDRINDVKISPNPVVEQADINFELLKKSDVQIDIYSPNGQLVDKVMHNTLQTGTQHIIWSPATNLNAAVYMYVIKLDGQTSKTGLITLVR